MGRHRDRDSGPGKAAPPNGWTRWGGYGYNYQYLGNARGYAGPGVPSAAPEFRRSDADIDAPALTVVVGDTEGARDGTEGQYALDPPLESANGSGKGGYYEGPAPADRALPGERGHNNGEFVFADGHAEAMSRDKLDDFDGDGAVDNGYYNTKGDASVR